MPTINTVNISGGGIQGITGSQGNLGAQGIEGIQKFQGVHNVWQTPSTNTIWLTYNMNGGTTTNASAIGSRMYFMCFDPAQNTVYSQLWINVNTGIAGALVRILIYSDLNGKPNTKLYESSSLDCSTSGQKIISVSGTFLAGVTYWLCFQSNVNLTVVSYQTASLYPLKHVQALGQVISSYIYTANLNEAPITLTPSSIVNNNSATPLIGISRG